MLTAAYLSQCTRPTDRIINATYGADSLVFARRRFAAGRVNFVPGFYTSEREVNQDGVSQAEEAVRQHVGVLQGRGDVSPPIVRSIA